MVHEVVEVAFQRWVRQRMTTRKTGRERWLEARSAAAERMRMRRRRRILESCKLFFVREKMNLVHIFWRILEK